MAFTPRLGNFQAPPPVVPQGLATRAPSAMARATGTGMTTNQGEKIPGLQGRGAGRDTGLGSLVSDMTQEIDNTSTPDELNYTMAQAGTELRKQLTGESEAEILAGQDNRTFLAQAMGARALAPAQSRVNATAQAKVDELNNNFPDEFFADGPIIFKMVGEEGGVQEVGRITSDGEFVPVDQIQADAAQMKTDALEALEPDEKVIDPLIDAYAKSLTATMAAPALTTEDANKQAKQVLGIDEKEDVPDWAMPLFAFGMALMAEPGPFGQAVGKAGLKALPAIAQVKKEKKEQRYKVARIAQDLMKTDVATRKGALSSAVGLIFKQKEATLAEAKARRDKSAEIRAIEKEIRAIDKERRETTDSVVKRQLERDKHGLEKQKLDLRKDKFKLDKREFKLKVFEGVQKPLKTLIESIPEGPGRLAVALALSERMADSKAFGQITGEPTAQQLSSFSGNLFKTTVDNLAKSGKNPELLLTVMGYAPSDLHKDYAERKVTVNQPVTNAEGITVNRQMERLVRLNIVPVNDFERDENGQIARDANDEPIVKTYAPGTLQVTLDDSGKILQGGNADPKWKGGTRVETVDGKQVQFSGIVNGKPFWDEGGRFWKQGQNFTRHAGDEGKPLTSPTSFNHIIQTDEGIQIISGRSDNPAEVIGAVGAGTATNELKQATTEVVALTRNWTQLRELALQNEEAILAAYKLESVQNAVLGLADYVAVVNKARPAFEGLLDGLDLFKNFGTGPGKQQAFLGGREIKGKGGLKRYARDILTTDYVESLEDVKLEAADGTVRAMDSRELSALQGLATMRKESRSMVFNLAYALARTNEPGGRLTDRDIANALMMMGVTENGSFRPRELINAMDRQVANRQAGIVDQFTSHLTPTREEIIQAGRVPDPIEITKEDLFTKRFKVPVYDPPLGRRFEKSDLRSGGENVNINRINAQNIARSYPILGADPQLYDPETQTWNETRLDLRLEATLRLLEKDPENAELLARTGNLGEIIKRLRPGQARR